jgi:hypothetical protein
MLLAGIACFEQRGLAGAVRWVSPFSLVLVTVGAGALLLACVIVIARASRAPLLPDEARGPESRWMPVLWLAALF